MEKLKRNQKGNAATTLSFIMALIVVVLLVQNIFALGHTLTLEEWARTNEHITIDTISFDQGYNLLLNVTNNGATDVVIIAVWVEPLDPQKIVKRYPVSEPIQIQETVNIFLPDSGQLLDIFEDFRVTVFTERGNIAYKKYEYHQSQIYDPAVGELGIFRIEWFFSKYSSLQFPPDSEGQPVKTAVSISKSEDYIAFYANLTNVWDRPCSILGSSFLGLPTIAPPQGGGAPNFFIVKSVDYTGTPSIQLDPVFEPILVYPQETRQVIFAALGATPAERGVWRWATGYPFGTEATTEGSDIQVSLFIEAYKLQDSIYIPSGRVYGQTISTQATILEAVV